VTLSLKAASWRDTLKAKSIDHPKRSFSHDQIIQICALYLPKSDYSKDDLINGVGVAMPPEMAGQMLNPKMRTFTF